MEHFVPLDPGATFLAYVSAKEAIPYIPVGMQSRLISPNPYWRLGYQFGRRLGQDRAEVLHVQYTSPLGCRIPVVVTVHDVSFLDEPTFFSPFRQRQLAITVHRTVQNAARILTCSEFSRQAIARAYRLNPDRIVVAPNAASPVFRPLDRQQAVDQIQRSYGIRAPFLLCVGNLQRRKNQLGLISAFQQLMTDQPDLPHHLVLVGKETAQAAEIRAVARQSPMRHRIHFTGFVDDSMLPWLYNACDLFVFPSFYEGFGIPVLEAMACGCPVASSNRTALPEVAGNTALYFNPASVSSMAETMRDMLRNLDFAATLGRSALDRAREFRWRRSAEIVLNTYRQAAGVPVRRSMIAQPSAVVPGS
jgi:glycosyltransferase involved in cell wall biosynthesis